MDRIGEYLISRMVGEGGMGKVYEAEERLSHRRVALKVLRQELSRSEDARRLFLNEMAILSGLDHPNVVRCLACTEADEHLVMVLEYLDGHTLRQLLTEEGPLSWQGAVAVTLQILSALIGAHGQTPPVIHRDLKPENVMILPDGTAKVMDFGIAKVLQAAAHATTHSVGTLQYMSPEQIDAAPVDGRTDLYALGLILYELLSGHPPFESASPRELLNLQCTAEPPPLPDAIRAGLPRGVELFMLGLLKKAPEERPASAQAAREELERFAPGGDLRASVMEVSELAAPVESAPASAGAPGAPRRPPARDTVALVEKLSAPAQIPWKTAIWVIVLLSALAALGTLVVRHLGAPPVPQGEERR